MKGKTITLQLAPRDRVLVKARRLRIEVHQNYLWMSTDPEPTMDNSVRVSQVNPIDGFEPVGGQVTLWNSGSSDDTIGVSLIVEE